MNKLTKLILILILCIIGFSCAETPYYNTPELVTVYQVVSCPSCNGSGLIYRSQCENCVGKGLLLADYDIDRTYIPLSENGSYYGQLNENGIPKTVFVKGYYRKDGTYVQSYYRSLPSSNYGIKTVRINPTVAENGSYYGEPSKTTGRPKDVHVDGYYRKDGTYVKGHYRSSPSRKK